MLRPLLFACFLLGAAFADPIVEVGSKCSKSCSDQSDSFLNYQTGKTYIYHFHTFTKLPTGSTVTGVDLKATVEVAVYEKCELAIQFRNVTLQGPNEKDCENFKKILESDSVAFDFQDGEIRDVCSSVNLPAWATNIAKGFLSTLQTNAVQKDNVEKYEVDILGKCKTRYTLGRKQWGGGFIVKKDKNLATCTDRYGADMAVFPFLDNLSEYINNPFATHSAFTCNQKIKNNILDSISCQEEHNLLLRERHKIKTMSVINLKTVEDTISFEEPMAFHRTSLLFEHKSRDVGYTKDDVERLLREICPFINQGIQIEATDYFAQLAYAIKHLTMEEMKSIYEGIENNTYCIVEELKGIFVGAVVSSDCGEAYAFTAELIKDKKVNGLEANAWYLALSMAKNTSEKAIEGFLPILENTSNRHALLGISAMISRYCSQENVECQYVKPVAEAVKILAKRLTPNCYNSDPDHEMMNVLLLKALGNIGYINDHTSDRIIACFKQKRATELVRITAIDALRHLPCDPKTQGEVLALLGRSKEPNTVRVSSFLHLMRCPSASTLQQLKHIYKRIHSREVSNFIRTYFANIQTTEDPAKQYLKSLMSNYTFEDEFPHLHLAFSRNFEISKYFSNINASFAHDLNVVFPNKGFFPSFASANFTLGAFGYLHNILEHYYYMKGVELYLDTLLRNWKITEKFYNLLPRYVRVAMVKKYLHSTLQTIKDKILGMSVEEDPIFVAGMRVYGSDIMHFSLEDLNDIQEFPKTIANIIRQFGGFKRTTGFTHGFMFLDTKLSIPTISGFPLLLDLNGTAIIDLKARFSIAMNESIALNLEMEPSFAARVTAQLSIDTYFSKPGTKYDAMLQVSRPIGFRIQLGGESDFKTTVTLPQDHIKLIQFRIDSYEVDHNGGQHRQKSNAKTTKTCTDRFDKALGIQICLETEISDSSFEPVWGSLIPINIPLAFKIEINKVDSLLESYVFKAQFLPQKDPPVKRLELSFDTPGSEINRYITVQLQIDNIDGGQRIELYMQAPVFDQKGPSLLTGSKLIASNNHKKEGLSNKTFPPDKLKKRKLRKKMTDSEMVYLSLTGLYLWTNTSLKANFSADINGAHRYSANAELSKTVTDQQQDYLGELDLTSGKKKLFLLRGEVKVGSVGKKTRIEASLKSTNRTVIIAKLVKQGEFSWEDGEKSGGIQASSDVTIDIPYLHAHIYAIGSKQERLYAYNHTIDYKIFERDNESMDLEVKLVDSSSEKVKKISATGKSRTSNCRLCNGKVNWDFEWGPSSKSFESELRFCSEKECNSKKPWNALHLASSVRDSDSVNRSVHLSIQLSIPSAEVDYDMEMDIEFRMETARPCIRVLASTKSQGKLIVSANFYHEAVTKKPLMSTTELTIGYRERELKYLLHMQETPDGVKVKAFLQLENEKVENVSMKFEYKKQLEENSTTHESWTVFSVPSANLSLEHKSIITVNKESLDIDTSFVNENKTILSINMKLSSKAASSVSFTTPSFECNTEVDLVTPTKVLKVDAFHKNTKSRRFIAVFLAHMEREDKELFLDVAWDADEDPSKKLHLEWSVAKTQNLDETIAKLYFYEKIVVDFKSTYQDKALHGPHTIQLNVTRNSGHSELTFNHEIQSGKFNTELFVKESGEEKLKLQAFGTYTKSECCWDIEAEAELTSSFKLVKDVHWNFKTSKELLDNQKFYDFLAEVEVGDSGKYSVETEISYPFKDYQKGEYKYNVTLLATKPDFKSFQILALADVDYPGEIKGLFEILQNSRKIFHIASNTQTSSNRYSTELEIFSSIPHLKNISVCYSHSHDDNRTEINNYYFSYVINQKAILSMEAVIDKEGPNGTIKLKPFMSPDMAVDLQFENFKSSEQDPNTKCGFKLHVDSASENLLDLEMETRKNASGYETNWLLMYKNEELSNITMIKLRQPRVDEIIEDLFLLDVRGISVPFELTVDLQRSKETKKKLEEYKTEDKNQCLNLGNHNQSQFILDVSFKPNKGKANETWHARIIMQDNSTNTTLEWTKRDKKFGLLGYSRKISGGYEAELDFIALDKVASLKAEIEEVDPSESRVYVEYISRDQKKMFLEVMYNVSSECSFKKCSLDVTIILSHQDWDQPTILNLTLRRYEQQVPRPLEVFATFDFPYASMATLYAETFVEVPSAQDSNVTYVAKLYDKTRTEYNTSFVYYYGVSSLGSERNISWWYIKSNKRKVLHSGSVYFLLPDKLNNTELLYRVQGHNVKITIRWEVISKDEVSIYLDIKNGEEVKHIKIVATRGNPCSSLLITENGNKKAEFKLCIDRDHLININATGVSFDKNNKPRLLAQVVAEEFIKGIVLFSIKIPFDRVTDLLEIPDKIDGMVSESHLSELWDDMMGIFDHMQPVFQNGFVDLVNETYRDELAKLREDIFVAYKELADSSIIVDLLGKMIQMLNEFSASVEKRISEKILEPIKASLNSLSEHLVDLLKILCPRGKFCEKIRNSGAEGRSAIIGQAMEDLKSVTEEYEILLANKIKEIIKAIKVFFKTTVVVNLKLLENKLDKVAKYTLPSANAERYHQIKQKVKDKMSSFLQVIDESMDSLTDVVSGGIGHKLANVKNGITSFFSYKSKIFDVKKLKNGLQQMIQNLIFSGSKLNYQLDFRPKKGEVGIEMKVPVSRSAAFLEKLTRLTTYYKTFIHTLSSLWR